MAETFITQIDIESVRNLSPISLKLGDTERKHLILTGKNGCGKTTLLTETKNYLAECAQHSPSDITNWKKRLIEIHSLLQKTTDEAKRANYQHQLKPLESLTKNLKSITLHFSDNFSLQDKIKTGKFVTCFFAASRISSFKVPEGIKKISTRPAYDINSKIAPDFIQLLVNLKADRSFAKDDNDSALVKEIDIWFNNFHRNLEYLLSNNVELEFDRKNYIFNIKEKNKEPYNFTQLSDGYSAILDILSELMLRMGIDPIKIYDVEGIVLIDEIETHLHIELQKKILPFLAKVFPKIQFIVTTHSPFVLSSISNSIIYDLEKGLVTEDLSQYSYEALVESYFDVDQYSERLKMQFTELKDLSNKKQLSEEEKENYLRLKNEISQASKLFSEELLVAYQNLQLDEILKK